MSPFTLSDIALRLLSSFRPVPDAASTSAASPDFVILLTDGQIRAGRFMQIDLNHSQTRSDCYLTPDVERLVDIYVTMLKYCWLPPVKGLAG